jgi:hypothetical protein
LPVVLSTNAGPLNVQFELDRTIFPGQRIDYEVEIELKGVDANEAAAAVNAFLASAHVERQSAPSKAKRFFDIVKAQQPTREHLTDEPMELLEAVRRAQLVAADLLKWLGYAQGYQATNQINVANSHIDDVRNELANMTRVLARWPGTRDVLEQLEQASAELPENVVRAKELVRYALDTLFALERRKREA